MTLKEFIRKILVDMLRTGCVYTTFKFNGIFYKLFNDGRLIKLGKYPSNIERPQDWFDNFMCEDEDFYD